MKSDVVVVFGRTGANVAEYVCIDGPLEGRRFSWRRAPHTGRPLTVALLDVDHGVLEVDYRVQPSPGPSLSGRLEFVAARDARLGRRRVRLPQRLAVVRRHARSADRVDGAGGSDLPGPPRS